jgi:hypothetical protein
MDERRQAARAAQAGTDLVAHRRTAASGGRYLAGLLDLPLDASFDDVAIGDYLPGSDDDTATDSNHVPPASRLSTTTMLREACRESVVLEGFHLLTTAKSR